MKVNAKQEKIGEDNPLQCNRKENKVNTQVITSYYTHMHLFGSIAIRIHLAVYSVCSVEYDSGMCGWSVAILGKTKSTKKK